MDTFRGSFFDGDELHHPFDIAARSIARLKRITIHAKLAVLGTLNIKARIKIARAAGFFKIDAEDIGIEQEQDQPVAAAGFNPGNIFERDAPVGFALLVTGGPSACLQLRHHVAPFTRTARGDAHNNALFDADLSLLQIAPQALPQCPKRSVWLQGLRFSQSPAFGRFLAHASGWRGRMMCALAVLQRRRFTRSIDAQMQPTTAQWQDKRK